MKCPGFGCGIEEKPYIHVLPDSPDYEYLLSVRERGNADRLRSCAMNGQIGYKAQNISYWLSRLNDPDITARIAALRSSGRATIGDALERYQTHIRHFLTSL